MTFPPQMDIVEGHVQDAVAKGAKVLIGGHKREGDGIFYEPTVLVDVDHTMKAMTEETFGPTLPIMKVRDAEEAIRLANDSSYGLGASVFTKDLERGEQIAQRVRERRGLRQRRDDQLRRARAADGRREGVRASGRATARTGIRKFCQQQSIVVSRSFPKRELHLYPYTERNTKLLGKALAFLYGRGSRD